MIERGEEEGKVKPGGVRKIYTPLASIPELNTRALSHVRRTNTACLRMYLIFVTPLPRCRAASRTPRAQGTRGGKRAARCRMHHLNGNQNGISGVQPDADGGLPVAREYGGKSVALQRDEVRPGQGACSPVTRLLLGRSICFMHPRLELTSVLCMRARARGPELRSTIALPRRATTSCANSS
eukprot:scaffold185694_cov27-Tisochrysis_lutea.AAC.2